jgi:hypothetical protein
MYELQKMERYLRVNLLGPGTRFMKKSIYRAAVSQMLRNTVLEVSEHFKSSENCTPNRSVSTYQQLEES